MYNTDEEFQTAVRYIRNQKHNIEPEKFLKLYGLYKQALFGNNTAPQPWFFFERDLEKWIAWNLENGKTKEQAKEEYISFTIYIKQILVLGLS